MNDKDFKQAIENCDTYLTLSNAGLHKVPIDKLEKAIHQKIKSLRTQERQLMAVLDRITAKSVKETPLPKNNYHDK